MTVWSLMQDINYQNLSEYPPLHPSSILEKDAY